MKKRVPGYKLFRVTIKVSAANLCTIFMVSIFVLPYVCNLKGGNALRVLALQLDFSDVDFVFLLFYCRFWIELLSECQC